MIKQTIEKHGGFEFPMLYCDYCVEGVSNRPEDDNAAKAFKQEHKQCRKRKNSLIDFKHLPEVPI